MTDSEFESKPQVLLIGQYSTGKTSFIKYIVGRNFPGLRIGPEPTTDRFMAVMDGPDERIIPGNALAVSPDLPYRGLERFGISFLNKFEGSQVPSPVLRNITLIDTPGILSGEKQRSNRGYDFVNVCSWFAERADLIILLFDAHKLDISDEFRAVIEKLKGHEDKIRCILNKADQVDRQRLMRVYGALLWAVGKVLKTPEVIRVYVGSFWDEPLMYTDNAKLFEVEEMDLMADLRDLPRNSAIRKINELVKRARMVRVHVYIISYLRQQMPMLTGKKSKQQELIANLPEVFRSVMKLYNLAYGDFPELEGFTDKLREQDFSEFPKLKPKMLELLDELLSVDIPKLMEKLPSSVLQEREKQITVAQPLNFNVPAVPIPEKKKKQSVANLEEVSAVPFSNANNKSMPVAIATTVVATNSSNPFGKDEPSANPFDDDEEEGKKETQVQTWVLQELQEQSRDMFLQYQPVDDKLSANNARKALLTTNLPKQDLRVIWDLSDVDRDGALDLEEFTLALHLCDLAKSNQLPEKLPTELIPPSKRT